MEIIVEIPGVPVAKKRPRFARRGKFVTTYNDQETEEGKFLLLCRSQIGQIAPPGVPVTLTTEFYFPIPKTTSKRKTEEMARGGYAHVKRPDLDNLIKFAKDCLNGVAWHDDSQVWSIYGVKTYSLNPRTRLVIKIDNPPATDQAERGQFAI